LKLVGRCLVYKCAEVYWILKIDSGFVSFFKQSLYTNLNLYCSKPIHFLENKFKGNRNLNLKPTKYNSDNYMYKRLEYITTQKKSQKTDSFVSRCGYKQKLCRLVEGKFVIPMDVIWNDLVKEHVSSGDTASFHQSYLINYCMQ